jgi:hypothetical protein
MRKFLAVAAIASLILGAPLAAIPATASPWSGRAALGTASAPLRQEAHYDQRRQFHAPHGHQHYAPPRHQARHQHDWHRRYAPPPRFDHRHPGHWR